MNIEKSLFELLQEEKTNAGCVNYTLFKIENEGETEALKSDLEQYRNTLKAVRLEIKKHLNMINNLH